MAVRSYSAKLGTLVPGRGGYDASFVGGAPPATPTTTTAQAAAVANATISGDGTALALVQAIATALAADVANSANLAGDVTVTINTATITTRAKLKAVLDRVYEGAISTGLAA